MKEALYELTAQWEDVFYMLYDDDVDDQVILDTLESIEGAIEEKADQYAIILRTMAGDIESIKQEEMRLHARRESLERRSKRMKDTLKSNLEAVGKTKFKTQRFSYSVCKNGGNQPVKVTEDIKMIPNDYLIPQPPIPDTNKIREYLKDHVVNWAQLLPRGEHLRIW